MLIFQRTLLTCLSCLVLLLVSQASQAPQGDLQGFSPEKLQRIPAFIKDAVCNRVWQTMQAIEEAISQELTPLWRIPDRVAQLVGTEGWLATQLNASAKVY